MQNSTARKYLFIILIAIITAVSFLYLIRPIADPDFFWHLKSGQLITEQKELPSQDPFAYTSTAKPTEWKHLILTGYWLSQITYSLFYQISGLLGIVFLRFITVAALVFIMFKRRYGDNTLYAGLILLFIVSILETFPIERPQVFSFLFFALLLLFLEKLRNDHSTAKRNIYVCTVPLLMLIWANTHPGYLVGQGALLLYVLLEGIKFFHPLLRPIKKEAYQKLLLACFMGIVFSFINPATFHAFELLRLPTYLSILSSSNIGFITNQEYMSSVQIFEKFNDYSILLYWFTMLLTFAALIVNFKKTDITDIALLAGTGFFSFMQVRYIPFFLIASLPVISRSFSKQNLATLAKVILIPSAVIAALFFAGDETANIKNFRTGSWIDENRYPVKSTDFIISSNIRGNMYNHYNWGGYLIWRLAPERKVFIDGRFLDDKIYMQAMTLNIAYSKEGEAVPKWKSILESYNVNYIITPISEPSDPFIPLVNALLYDNDWSLVFAESNSMVFIKNIPENFSIINKYAIPKRYLSR